MRPRTMNDKQGLELSTDDPEIVSSINHFTEQVLGYGTEPHLIISVAEAAPDSVFVNAITAYILLQRENIDPNVDTIAKAKQHITNVRRNIAKANERERAYLEVAEITLENLQSGGYGTIVEKIVAMLEDIVDRWPRDILALKLAHIHYFNLGDSQAMLRTARKASMDESHPYHHYLLGMLSFAEVECGLVDVAERHGVEGTRRAHEQRDPWAHHAVAHCMEVTGRVDEGIRWMEGLSHLWDNCGSFMYTHNWWHTALYYIDREAEDTVLKLYDEKIWGKSKESAQDQLGAASLLWRLRLRGTDVGNRWEDIADYMSPHIKEHIQPFIDLHYIYAMASAGREERVQEMLDSLHNTNCYARKQKEVALPLAKAVVAHAKGDHHNAFSHMDPIISRSKEIGGSNAQQDMFEQTYIDVLLNSGNHHKARPLLESRFQCRPRTPAVLRQLSNVYTKSLGEPEEATKAQTRANHWSQYYATHTPHDIVKNGNYVSSSLDENLIV